MAKILAISGSLRAASTNTALLRAFADQAPDGFDVEIAKIGHLPHFDSDLGEVADVEAFKAAIGAADAVLIATPEYNYSVPGVLKNAIDWASRPGYQSVFSGKPVAIIGAAASLIGTARAQAHLKNILLGMLAEVFPYPEFAVGRSFEKFTDGALTDEATRGFVDQWWDRFPTWLARFSTSET